MTAHIHVFSGLGSSIFSAFRKGTEAIESLIDDLPAKADAQHHIWNDWPEVRDAIRADFMAGKLTGPVILIGHSNGVLACMEISASLEMIGCDVDYIGAIDPTLAQFALAGSNIKKIDDFHASMGFVAFGRAISGGKKATVIRSPRFKGVLKVFKINSGHVGCASHPAVKARIVENVWELLK